MNQDLTAQDFYCVFKSFFRFIRNKSLFIAIIATIYTPIRKFGAAILNPKKKRTVRNGR